MLVQYLGRVLDLTAQTFAGEEVEAYADERAARFFDDLDEMARLSRDHGIRFMVISQQAKSHLVAQDRIKGVSYEEEYALVLEKLKTDRITSFELAFAIHHAIMQRLPSWAGQQGLEYVDGIRALDGDRDQLTSWVHLTPRANHLLGSAIATAILGESIRSVMREPRQPER